jgi:predicted kinase
MIRAGGVSDKGLLILAGLSEGNVERLKADMPIRASLKSFGVSLPGELVIMYGRTEAEIEDRLRQAGLIDSALTCVGRDEKTDRHNAIDAAHDKILIATHGLPRSGKSTWAQKQAWPVVCPDSIRLALHGQRFYAPAEPVVWAAAKLMVRSLFLAGHKHVVLDATAGTRARRDEWKSKDYALYFKAVDVSKEECVARARAINDEEIVPVIERMAASWEPLGEDELRW